MLFILIDRSRSGIRLPFVDCLCPDFGHELFLIRTLELLLLLNNQVKLLIEFIFIIIIGYSLRLLATIKGRFQGGLSSARVEFIDELLPLIVNCLELV